MSKYSLNITIGEVKCSGLRAADLNGYSDPYVIFDFGEGIKFQTPVKKKTLNPVWTSSEFTKNFTLELKSAQDLANRKLNIQVYDHDIASKHDKLGECELNLEQSALGATTNIIALSGSKLNGSLQFDLTIDLHSKVTISFTDLQFAVFPAIARATRTEKQLQLGSPSRLLLEFQTAVQPKLLLKQPVHFPNAKVDDVTVDLEGISVKQLLKERIVIKLVLEDNKQELASGSLFLRALKPDTLIQGAVEQRIIPLSGLYFDDEAGSLSGNVKISFSPSPMAQLVDSRNEYGVISGRPLLPIGLKVPTGFTATPVPSKMVCQFTKNIMLDPVNLANGSTFDRTAIEEWLLSNDIDPQSGEYLSDKRITPNKQLKEEIRCFFKVNPAADANRSLAEAVLKGDLAAVQLSLFKGANINFRYPADKLNIEVTPILHAALLGHLEIFQHLLQEQANIAAVTSNGFNILHCASYSAHDAILAELIKLKAVIKVNALSEDASGRLTPIFLALKNPRQIFFVDSLVKEFGAKLEATTQSGYSAVHYLAASHNFAALKSLFGKVNTAKLINLQTGDTGDSALHLALQTYGKGDSYQTIELLLDSGANANLQNKEGNSALHFTALLSSDRVRVAELLFKHKIDPEPKNKQQSTALAIASELGDSRLELVIKKYSEFRNSTPYDVYLLWKQLEAATLKQ